MKHFTTVLAAVILANVTLIQFSCKKSDPAAATPDVAAMLQNKNWKLTALTVSPAMAGVTDIYNDNYDACERDDLYKFNPSNIFILDEGLTTCHPGDPQTHDGTWDYNSTSKNLHFRLTPPSDEYDLVITQIDNNHFTGTTVDVISGVNYTSTWTFVKQ